MKWWAWSGPRLIHKPKERKFVARSPQSSCLGGDRNSGSLAVFLRLRCPERASDLGDPVGRLIWTSILIPGVSERRDSFVSVTSPLASVVLTRCLKGQRRPLQRPGRDRRGRPGDRVRRARPVRTAQVVTHRRDRVRARVQPPVDAPVDRLPVGHDVGGQWLRWILPGAQRAGSRPPEQGRGVVTSGSRIGSGRPATLQRAKRPFVKSRFAR